MPPRPLILGIESTCDETAAAVVAGGTHVIASVVASQDALHAKFRGVVPEIASRAHIEAIIPVLRQTADAAGIGLADVDAISIASRPGLIGSLLVGLTAAKTLAWSLGKPLVAVDHVKSHLYSVLLQDPGSPAPDVRLPAVGMVVSGGHTAMYDLRAWDDIRPLGRTIDDAVGEAYDKVSAILGLTYPGGPVIDRLAADGDPDAVRFPRTLLDRDSLDFSFSGIKTSVLYHVRGHKLDRRPQDLSPRQIADVCASFQAACIDVVIEKLRRAIRQTRARTVILGGGVSANRGLRAALPSLGVATHVPPMRYCTDNAAMSAGLAALDFAAGRFAGLDLDAMTASEIA